MLRFLSLFFLFFCLSAFAGVEQLSEKEFRDLAAELALKVNLFQEVWQKDPSAVFYGGTTRDYLYWLKGKFREAKNVEDAVRISQELKKLSTIDVRSFIIGDSDVDIIATEKPDINVAKFGVRKLDAISADVFDPKTVLGKNELWQGYIPAEKIRLTRQGLSQAPELGDGVREIYRGKLTVHFADPAKFAQTKYAMAGENHPVLLALRYLRLQAINYYQTYGQGVPDKAKLLAAIDPASYAKVKEVIHGSMEQGELKTFLYKDRFRSWINGTIQKAFRSYTNPTAALELMKEFGADLLSRVYGENSIESIYQYVFSEYRNPEKIAKNLHDFGVNPELFFQKAKDHFPDGHLYHGTKSEKGFRSIIFQGVLPSSSGSAGPGLYGVSSGNKEDAERWGGEKERLLRLPVKAEAKIVDISKEGEGRRVWEEFSKKFGKEKHQEFARTFGIDILKYPYDFEAYVVENSDKLGRAQGVYRQLLPFQELLAKVAQIHEAPVLLQLLEVNQLTSQEVKLALQHSPIPQMKLLDGIRSFAHKDINRAVALFQEYDLWKKNLVEFEPLILAKGNPQAVTEVLNQIADRANQDPEVMLNVFRQIKTYEAESGVYPFLAAHAKNTYAYDAVMLLLENGHTQMFSSYWEFANSHFSKERQSAVLEKIVDHVKDQPDWQLYNFFRFSIFKKPSVERLESFKKYLENMGLPLAELTVGPHIGEDHILFELARKWAQKFPEVLELYLAREANEVLLEKIIHNVFVTGASNNKELLGRFLRKFFTPEAISAIGLDHPQWYTDVGVLHRLFDYLAHARNEEQRPSREVAIFNSLIANQLLANDLWQNDPRLLSALLRNSYVDANFPVMASWLDLKKHPELLADVIHAGTTNAEGIFYKPFVAQLERICAREEWSSYLVKHPELIQQLIEKESYFNVTTAYEYQILAAEILRDPRMELYPELVMQLAKYALKKVFPKDLTQKLNNLLALPHWKEHPAFATAKQKGKVDLTELAKLSLVHRESCAGFFKKQK